MTLSLAFARSVHVSLSFASASAGSIVVLGLGAILAAAGWFGAWRAWHAAPYPPRSGFPQRDREDMRRRLPASAVCITFLVLALAIDVIWGKTASGAQAGIDVCTVIGLAAGVVAISVGMAQRPRWAMPPGLRPSATEPERSGPRD